MPHDRTLYSSTWSLGFYIYIYIYIFIYRFQPRDKGKSQGYLSWVNVKITTRIINMNLEVQLCMEKVSSNPLYYSFDNTKFWFISKLYSLTNKLDLNIYVSKYNVLWCQEAQDYIKKGNVYFIPVAHNTAHIFFFFGTKIVTEVQLMQKECVQLCVTTSVH